MNPNNSPRITTSDDARAYYATRGLTAMEQHQLLQTPSMPEVWSIVPDSRTLQMALERGLTQFVAQALRANSNLNLGSEEPGDLAATEHQGHSTNARSILRVSLHQIHNQQQSSEGWSTCNPKLKLEALDLSPQEQEQFENYIDPIMHDYIEYPVLVTTPFEEHMNKRFYNIQTLLHQMSNNLSRALPDNIAFLDPFTRVGVGPSDVTTVPQDYLANLDHLIQALVQSRHPQEQCFQPPSSRR